LKLQEQASGLLVAGVTRTGLESRPELADRRFAPP
jgi:hypothetical protein